MIPPLLLGLHGYLNSLPSHERSYATLLARHMLNGSLAPSGERLCAQSRGRIRLQLQARIGMPRG